LQHGLNIGVQRRREIGDIAVNKELAGAQTDNLVGRYPAVRATDPEILWRLRGLAVVTAHDNVLHLQSLHGVLQHGLNIGVQKAFFVQPKPGCFQKASAGIS
jgi:hypothetical protein